MSPSPPQRGSATEAFRTVRIPWLVMTGTLDSSPIGGTTPAARREVFAALPSFSRYSSCSTGPNTPPSPIGRCPAIARRATPTTIAQSLRSRPPSGMPLCSVIGRAGVAGRSGPALGFGGARCMEHQIARLPSFRAGPRVVAARRSVRSGAHPPASGSRERVEAALEEVARARVSRSVRSRPGTPAPRRIRGRRAGEDRRESRERGSSRRRQDHEAPRRSPAPPQVLRSRLGPPRG